MATKKTETSVVCSSRSKIECSLIIIANPPEGYYVASEKGTVTGVSGGGLFPTLEKTTHKAIEVMNNAAKALGANYVLAVK